MDPQEQKAMGPQVLAGLIMIPVYAKISMTVVTACSEIVASTSMTGLIIRLGGNWRKTLRELKENVGEESITLI